MDKKIKEEVVILNALFCVFVVFSHICSDFIATAAHDDILFLAVVPFLRLGRFMSSGFVFLAAYKLFFSNTISDYKAYILKRIKIVFLPYVIWNVIYYINFVLWGYFPFSIYDLIYYIFDGTLSAPFYFVLVIMQFYILLPLWQLISNKVNPVYAIIVAFILNYYLNSNVFRPIYASILPNHTIFFDRLFLGFLVVWVLGMYCGKNRDLFLKFITEKRMIIRGFCLFFALIVVVLEYQLQLNDKVYPYTTAIYHCYMYFALFVCFEWANRKKSTNWMEKINEISYNTYLNHCFVLLYVSRFLRYTPISDPATLFIISMILVFSITFLGNWVLLLINNRLKRRKINV